ncbi:MAG: T9SS type A sorting domain-containing protein [Bacteroidota bacterium]
MKKLILSLLSLSLIATSSAQISLENTYPASTGLTELAVSGFKYYMMDVVNNQCKLYNIDHSLWKTINLIVPAGMYLYDIRYVSETLFNTDNKVELAYIYYSYDTTLLFYTYYTMVVNEDGQLLLSIPGCSYLEVKAPGAYGTKMLAYVYDYSIVLWTMNTQVYSLPGNLPTGEISVEGNSFLNRPFPNPASANVTIPYQLPFGVNTAEIRLINESGKLIKSYTVDRTFRELLIQIADLPKGIYVYQVKSDQGIFSSGKLIHD